MITVRELAFGVYGAWRLLKLDRDGMAYFDATVAGFWRSFWVAALVAPPFFLLVALRFDAGEVQADPLRYWMVEAVAYVIAWLVFPVVMISVCRFLDREHRFVAFIVAYNWTALLQNGFYLPVALAGAVGLISGEAEGFLSLLVLSGILAYQWFVTRVALVVPPMTAVAIVVLDLLVSLFVNAVTMRLY